MKEERTYVRFNRHFIVQHLALMLSVTLLALTGLALMYHNSWLGRMMIFLEGGMDARGFLHRAAAVLLLAAVMYHLMYSLFTRVGHKDLMEMMPRWRDFQDYILSLKYQTGLSDNKPIIGRFGYKEKFQYWLITLFTALMVVSGLALWFHNWVLSALPKWVIDVSFVVHGSTGVLLFLFLMFWHMYEVHLAPTKFPGTLSWLDGKISMRELKEEHPLEYSEAVSEDADK